MAQREQCKRYQAFFEILEDADNFLKGISGHSNCQFAVQQSYQYIAKFWLSIREHYAQ